MNQTFLRWEIVPQNAPQILHRCHKCGKMSAFASTGKFRINANQKNLDVWLIYSCTACGATWNMDLYTRVSPKDLPPQLYTMLLRNDKETALQYAFDRTILTKNEVQPLNDTVIYQVLGDVPDLKGVENCLLEINCPRLFGLRVFQPLSQKLHLTRSQIHTLFQNGSFALVGKTGKGEKTKLEKTTQMTMQTIG